MLQKSPIFWQYSIFVINLFLEYKILKLIIKENILLQYFGKHKIVTNYYDNISQILLNVHIHYNPLLIHLNTISYFQTEHTLYFLSNILTFWLEITSMLQ